MSCTGSPAVEVPLILPAQIPGFICLTPPIGPYSHPRFAQCCSNAPYNITGPTDPSDPAYPVSCGLFCQMDPNPDLYAPPREYTEDDPGLSKYFACLSDGGREFGEFQVSCEMNVVEGVEGPVEFENKWYESDGDGDVWEWATEGNQRSELFGDRSTGTATTATGTGTEPIAEPTETGGTETGGTETGGTETEPELAGGDSAAGRVGAGGGEWGVRVAVLLGLALPMAML